MTATREVGEKPRQAGGSGPRQSDQFACLKASSRKLFSVHRQAFPGQAVLPGPQVSPPLSCGPSPFPLYFSYSPCRFRRLLDNFVQSSIIEPMPQHPHVPQEVEAKLLASGRATLSAIARLKHVEAYRLRPRQTVHLYTVYLDTPTFALAREGIALRLRRNRTRWEASLKWSGKEDGVIHARPELTVRLSCAPTFPFSLPAVWQNIELPHLMTEMPLEPILVSVVHRQRFAVYAEGRTQACAELALDRVRLRSPQRGSRPVAIYCEIEIEQESGGTVQDLLHFAALLQKRFALTPAQGSKFSRGLSLLYGFESTQENSAAQPCISAQRPAVRKKASPPTTQQ